MYEVFQSLEAPIYTDEISNRERRSLRQRPKSERLGGARKAQSEAGFKVRVSRHVLNERDFKPELGKWIPFVQSFVAKRRSMGNLAITLFDTSQQPLRYSEGFESEEYLTERLFDRRPELEAPTPPIEVRGLSLFGNEGGQPFVGLTLAPGFIYQEIDEARRIIAPELALDRSHQLDHIPHVTLGQVLHRDSVGVIMSELEGSLPSFVQFAKADVSYEAA